MKRAIVLVSFGASHDNSRKLCLEALAEDFRKEFPEAVIRQAYTSVFIRRALENAASLLIHSKRPSRILRRRTSARYFCSRRI